MTQPKRRGRPPRLDGDDRSSGSELLLHAAIAQFARHGFDGASVRLIAREADVDPALVTHKFGSKLLLWQAAIDHLSAELAAAIGGFSPPTASPRKAIESVDHVTGQLVDFLCDMPEIAAFILREVAQQNDRSAYSFDKLVRPIYELVRPIIGAFLHPSNGEADPDFLFFAIMGAIVSSVAARPFLARLSDAASDDQAFRETLKQTMSAQLSARFGRTMEAAT